MPEEATLDVARFVDGDIEKFYPISEGDTKQRKRKPHIVAVINEMCTGCSGSPACVDYCPVAACMFWVPDSEHAPFGRIMVDWGINAPRRTSGTNASIAASRFGSRASSPLFRANHRRPLFW